MGSGALGCMSQAMRGRETEAAGPLYPASNSHRGAETAA